MIEIILVRHGETVLNREKKMQGWSDGPLFPESLEKAEQLGKYFLDNNISFDAFYSSDSNRAVNTMEAIKSGMAETAKTEKKTNFREMYFGQAESQNIDDVWQQVAQTHGYVSKDQMMNELDSLTRVDLLHKTPDYSDAESLETLFRRIKEGLQSVAKQAEENNYQRILITAHGITILAILKICQMTEDFRQSFGNLSCSKIVYDNNQFSIAYINHQYV